MTTPKGKHTFFPTDGGLKIILPGEETSGVSYSPPFRIATRNTNPLPYESNVTFGPGNIEYPADPGVAYNYRRNWDLDFDKRSLRDFLESMQPRSCRSPMSAGLYRTIDNGLEMRVLEIDPAQSGEPISGRLRHLTLEFEFPPEFNVPEPNANYEILGPGLATTSYTAPASFGIDVESRELVPYTALSYVWGDQVETCSVEIEGHTISVTSSLLGALQNLRHEKEHVILWVDQICIDQNSDRDKEKQIRLMDRIYRRAWTTAIWIGEEPDQGAFRALQGLYEATQGRTDLSAEEIELMRNPDPRLEAAGTFLKLEALFDRPWFTRTWVIQEAALSRAAYLVTGNTYVCWQTFCGWADALLDFGIFREKVVSSSQDDEAPIHGWQSAREIYKIGEANYMFVGRPSVLRILADTRYAKASKAVDKIFSVLGLCNLDIEPDYSITAPELFQKVANHIVDNGYGHNVFRLLSCVDHEPQVDLPSWAVDWSKPRVTAPLAFSTSSFNCFDAGGYGMLRGDVKQWLCRRNDRQLVVTGKPFSTITVLSASLKVFELIPDAVALSQSSWKACVDFATAREQYGAATFASFVSTVTAGKDSTLRQKSPSEFANVASLLCDTVSGRKPTFTDQIYSKRHQQGHFTLEHLKQRSMGRHFQGFKKAFAAAVNKRRLCWTANGNLALVPRTARTSDEIWAFPRSAVAFVLRSAPEHGQYLVIGECYCHEVMDGKFVRDELVPLRDVRLV
ncbi:Heterokaryon incompatibility protein 6, OR allele [Pseudocercospora fuligena]|uniref:Heterokaryon incompatibility protein 6, OR allele n=1 Tax=Pseudocercospora fuligena TaxID=685502 RepID=A0A8H6R820_9PEZI|nr:Heterokaryon incompatibility protein 6, OR allele [Pseudocercospora fuligena]